MKKLIALSLGILLILCLSVNVFAAEPIWQVSGDKIGFKNFKEMAYTTSELYSHTDEANSDYHSENKTLDGTNITYKHITPAGVEARPQKQINLDIPIGNPEEIFIVGGQIMNDGDEFFLELKEGMCIKVVVRTNYSVTPKIKFDNFTKVVEAPALAATGDWEEVYFTIPSGISSTVFNFCLFIFGDTNKEDYIEGAYADVAAIAIFKNYDEAASSNIAPELIKSSASEEPTATETPIATETPDVTETPATTETPETTPVETLSTQGKVAAPQTADTFVIAALATLISAGAAAIFKKKR
jgi:cell division septation protein DedD